MLRYRIDVMDALKQAGYTQYALRRDNIFGGGDLKKIRDGVVLGNIGLNSLCTLLRCQPGKLIEWVPDETTEE